MKKREFCIILGSALLAAGVSGCKESASKKYSSAQELINKGEYSEAVKKLREITSYEDSSQLLLYASANAAAVEGSFSEAITTLQSLGDYKDSQNLIVYYSAKQAEAQEDVYDIQYIASLYESIPLFRDSKEQEEAYLSGWYQTAVTDAEAENYAEAYPIFDNLGSYNDSDKMIDYYEARRLEAEGDYISMLKAKRVYDTMPQVVDCADRSSKILETLQTVYKDAQEKMKNGEYELALKEFESLGTYENSADLVDKLKEEIANQKLYKAAEDSLSKQDYSDAIKKFGELGSYADAKQRKEAIQQARYEAAEKMMNDENFEGAIAEFQMLGSYKESKKSLNLAKQELTKQNAYKNAEQLYKKEDYKSAIQQFAELGEYKDAANRKKEIQAERYKAAEDMIESGDFEGAIAEFEMLGSYEDAKQRAEDTITELANKTAYEEAEDLLTKGDYAGAVHAFAQLRDYKDAAAREKEIQEQRYEEADKLADDEEFEGAIAIFEELGNYSDAKQRVTDVEEAQKDKIKLLCANQRYAEALHFQNLQVGDVIKFGEYGQDNNLENGKEAIDWIVLDVKDNQAFLISNQCLEVMQFAVQEGPGLIFWEESDVYRWLNSDFLNSAFSENLQDCIIQVPLISAGKDSNGHAEVGKESLNYIFVLDETEYNKYKYLSMKNNAGVTAYVQAYYMDTNEYSDKYKGWWLRDVRYSIVGESRAKYVDETGFVDSVHCNNLHMVRPAMRIDLAKCEEAYQQAYDAGELDNLPITEIPETEEVTEDSEASAEGIGQTIGKDSSTNTNANTNTNGSNGDTDVTETSSQTQETDSYTPGSTTGNAAAIVNPAVRDRSDYLCIDQNEATGQILLYFYLCPGSNGMYNSIACDNEYLECGPSGNAKELVDRSLSGELGVLPGYGNKKTIVWNSPYGICAYSRSQSQYWNGTNGEYMLNEDEIYQMLNTMGAPVEMVPNSQKQD